MTTPNTLDQPDHNAGLPDDLARPASGQPIGCACAQDQLAERIATHLLAMLDDREARKSAPSAERKWIGGPRA